MIVDETNPATPEADPAMPETASLTHIAVKRRKSADGSEPARKARKLGDSAGGAKVVKRGRKAAIVFDDSVPVTRPVQFDPAAATGNGATAPATEPMADVRSAPALEPAPVTAAPPEPAPMEAMAPPPEPTPAEMNMPVVEFSELPMPIDIEIEFLPNPESQSMPAVEAFEIASSDDVVEPDEPSPRDGMADPPPPPAAASEAAPEAIAKTWPPETPEIEMAPESAPDEASAMTDEVPSNGEQAASKSPASRFQAIARAARMSALSTSKPGIARTIAVDAARSAEKQKRATEIFGYWVRAKNGRRFPSRTDFEIAKVAEFWPNSMLLTCDANAPTIGNHISFSKVMRLDASDEGNGSEFNFTSMIIEWILTIGGEAARVGQPVQDTEVFPSSDGTHAYKIVALPLSDHQTQVDHVLCHLTRS